MITLNCFQKSLIASSQDFNRCELLILMNGNFKIKNSRVYFSIILQLLRVARKLEYDNRSFLI